jgi:hypothetical protein
LRCDFDFNVTSLKTPTPAGLQGRLHLLLSQHPTYIPAAHHHLDIVIMPRHLGFSDSVNFTISLCLTYTLCISCVRIWIRKGAFGVDDIVIAIATLVSFGHTAADYVALANGLGTPWAHIVNEENLSSLNAVICTSQRYIPHQSADILTPHQASIAGIVTYIISLYLSKCAMISFLGRITKTHNQISLYHICNALTAMIGVASLLTVTTDCPSGSGYYWAFHSNRFLACPSQVRLFLSCS